MDDFVVRAALGGVGVALIAGPLGCFLVWRRMAYFGGAVSHSALLGIGLGLILSINFMAAIAAICVAMALLLYMLERHPLFARDTLIGILAHAGLAGGLVLLSFVEGVRIDLASYLFGDVLALDQADLILIGLVALSGLIVIAWLWRALLNLSVHADLAEVEGVARQRTELAFMLLIALVIAVGMKVVGVLLIVSLLIIPAAAARPLSDTPERMAAIAAGIGVIAVFAGLSLSLRWDTPAGPSIVMAASGVFIASLLFGRVFGHAGVR
jgi:zinc transport system permease protein